MRPPQQPAPHAVRDSAAERDAQAALVRAVQLAAERQKIPFEQALKAARKATQIEAEAARKATQIEAEAARIKAERDKENAKAKAGRNARLKEAKAMRSTSIPQASINAARRRAYAQHKAEQKAAVPAQKAARKAAQAQARANAQKLATWKAAQNPAPAVTIPPLSGTQQMGLRAPAPAKPAPENQGDTRAPIPLAKGAYVRHVRLGVGQVVSDGRARMACVVFAPQGLRAFSRSAPEFEHAPDFKPASDVEYQAFRQRLPRIGDCCKVCRLRSVGDAWGHSDDPRCQIGWCEPCFANAVQALRADYERDTPVARRYWYGEDYLVTCNRCGRRTHFHQNATSHRKALHWCEPCADAFFTEPLHNRLRGETAALQEVFFRLCAALTRDDPPDDSRDAPQSRALAKALARDMELWARFERSCPAWGVDIASPLR